MKEKIFKLLSCYKSPDFAIGRELFCKFFMEEIKKKARRGVNHGAPYWTISVEDTEEILDKEFVRTEENNTWSGIVIPDEYML